MPPRRSSRAASASLATPLVETLPIKRKRGHTLEPHNVELEEDDVEAKPKRGKRGSSVVKVSRPPRRSSRAASTSLETAPVGSVPIKQKIRGQTIQSHILEEEEVKLEDEEEVDENLKRAAALDDIDEEAPLILNGRRTSPKPKASVQQSDDEMDAMSDLSELDEDEEEEVKPVRKVRKVPTARKAKVTTKKSVKTTVIEDSDDDSDTQAPPSAQPRSQHHNGSANAAQVVSNI
jgi:hypothetical protein